MQMYALGGMTLGEPELRRGLNGQQDGIKLKDFTAFKVVDTQHTGHARLVRIQLNYDNETRDVALKFFGYRGDRTNQDTFWHVLRSHPDAAFANERRAYQLIAEATPHHRTKRPGLAPKRVFEDIDHLASGTMWVDGPDLDALLVDAYKRNDHETVSWLRENAVYNLARFIGLTNAHITSSESFNAEHATQQARARHSQDADALSRYLTMAVYKTHLAKNNPHYDHIKVLNFINTKYHINLLQRCKELLGNVNAFATIEGIEVWQHRDYKPEHALYHTMSHPDSNFSQTDPTTPHSFTIDHERAGYAPLGTDLGALLARSPAGIILPDSVDTLLDTTFRFAMLERILRHESMNPELTRDLVQEVMGYSAEQVRSEWNETFPSQFDDRFVPEKYLYASVFGTLASGAISKLERHANFLRRGRRRRRALVQRLGDDFTDRKYRESHTAGLNLFMDAASAIEEDFKRKTPAWSHVGHFFNGFRDLCEKLEILQERESRPNPHAVKKKSQAAYRPRVLAATGS